MAAPTGTRITTSNECSRRSFLDERIAGDGSNDKAVKGTLTHNLIQVRRLAASGMNARKLGRPACVPPSPAVCLPAPWPARSAHASAAPPPPVQAALTSGLRTDPQLGAAAERIVADATEVGSVGAIVHAFTGQPNLLWWAQLLGCSLDPVSGKQLAVCWFGCHPSQLEPPPPTFSPPSGAV